MLRTALQPRWAALLVLLVAVVWVFGRLGLWQLDVAQDEQALERLQQQATQQTVPLDTLVQPHQSFPADGVGRSVTVRGKYDASRQFLVPARVLEGREGWWVVTPLRTEAGATLPVMRGWVSSPVDADQPASTPVELTGTLAPGEGPAETAELPDGQLGSIDLGVLANTWAPDEIYNAFVFLAAEQPSLSAGAVTSVPPPSYTEGGVDWRNLGYALQWWVFAAFAVYMYLRFLADAARHREPEPDRVAQPADIQ